MAFGVEKNRINKLFNHFIDFEYANPNIKRIGAVSANGFVTQIEYDTHIQNPNTRSYKSNAILKSALTRNADNLYYEYLVGKLFINEQSKKFPCFLETYGCFTYKSPNAWDIVKNITKQSSKLIHLGELLTFMKRDFNLNDLNYACKKSQFIAILVENIKDAKTLRSYLKDQSFILQDLLGVLLQIYIPLSHLSTSFTHYDLHDENILIYKPFGESSNKYITYHYHLSDTKIITFKSKYLVKIIDYGRSFFDDNNGISSKDINSNLCRLPECNNILILKDEDDEEIEIENTCGESVGFSWLYDEPGNYDNHYITSIRRNISHDLRLLIMINKRIKINDTDDKYENKFTETFLKILKMTVYQKETGTPERMEKIQDKILNVNDAFHIFDRMINTNIAKNINNKYYNNVSENGGNLHIYTDKPMQFIEPVIIRETKELDNTMKHTLKRKKSPKQKMSPKTLKRKISSFKREILSSKRKRTPNINTQNTF